MEGGIRNRIDGVVRVRILHVTTSSGVLSISTISAEIDSIG